MASAVAGLIAAVAFWPAAAAAQEPAVPLPEITVSAPQPRYVAPTLRDRIGRIWAPVYINGEGPFRLVLDTGASRSAVIERIATQLGLPPADEARVLLKGVTGQAEVARVVAASVEVGDLLAENQILLVVADAFGGADGVLATRSLGERRIHVEFRKDRIEIAHAPHRRAPPGFTTLPLRMLRQHVPYIDVRVGGVRTKAVIDTGAQQTTANLALRDALARRRRSLDSVAEDIIGVTGDIQPGVSVTVPPIELGEVAIRNARMTFADAFIFEEWRLQKEPAILIGMDVWGVLDTMILDYRRRELQIRLLRGDG